MTDRLSGAETRVRIIAATAAILETDGIRHLTVTRVMAPLLSRVWSVAMIRCPVLAMKTVPRRCALFR